MASAAAAQDDDGTMGYDAEEAAAMIQEAIDALGEAEHALIDALFKAWDWNDDGKIEIARLSSNGVNVTSARHISPCLHPSMTFLSSSSVRARLDRSPPLRGGAPHRRGLLALPCVLT